MFSNLARLIRVISTEDDNNVVFDPVRVGAVAGVGVYLLGGLSIVVMGLHTVWFTTTPIDYQSFGIGFAAWGGGLGAILAGVGGAMFAKAHADATSSTVKVTEMVESPPEELQKKTTITEVGPKAKGKSNADNL